MSHRGTPAWVSGQAWYVHTGSRTAVWAIRGQLLPQQNAPGRWIALIERKPTTEAFASLMFLWQRGEEWRAVYAIILTEIPERGVLLNIRSNRFPRAYNGRYRVCDAHPTIFRWRGRLRPLLAVQKVGPVDEREPLYIATRYR